MTIYTYIGQGEDAPAMINFMGRQEFMIGEAVDVTNETLLEKLKGNQSFKEGEVDRKVIIKAAQKAKEKANERRKDDKELNAREIKRRK